MMLGPIATHRSVIAHFSAAIATASMTSRRNLFRPCLSG